MASLQSTTFNGNLTVSSKINLQQVFEKVSIVSTPATGTINIDLLSQAMYLYSSAATANWILNVRGNSSTTLDSILAVGETISFAMINNTGTTPRYPSSFRIDGTEIRVKWYDGLDPSAINLVGNSFDVYNFMIIKRAVSTYTVIGSYGKYA
jgi:hypothetical protein